MKGYEKGVMGEIPKSFYLDMDLFEIGAEKLDIFTGVN